MVNRAVNSIITIIILLLIILAVGFYIYLKDKLDQIKIEKEKTFIERADAEIKRLKSTD